MTDPANMRVLFPMTQNGVRLLASYLAQLLREGLVFQITQTSEPPEIRVQLTGGR